jgi:hypothetical protein
MSHTCSTGARAATVAADLMQVGSVHVAADLLAGLPDPAEMPLPDDDRRVAEIAQSLKTIDRWNCAMRERWRRHLRTLPAR